MALQIAVSAAGGREVVAELERIGKSVQPVVWHKLWGHRVAIQAHRAARAKGGRSFWGDVASAALLARVDAQSALVAVDHVAAAQKQYGGTIRAKNAKALTIPITEEASGKRAAEFAMGGRELFTIVSKAGNTILGYANGDDFVPLYVLKRSVTQKADPFFPSDDEIGAIGVSEGLRLLEAV